MKRTILLTTILLVATIGAYSQNLISWGETYTVFYDSFDSYERDFISITSYAINDPEWIEQNNELTFIFGQMMGLAYSTGFTTTFEAIRITEILEDGTVSSKFIVHGYFINIICN